jgi:hypothetical protein
MLRPGEAGDAAVQSGRPGSGSEPFQYITNVLSASGFTRFYIDFPT